MAGVGVAAGVVSPQAASKIAGTITQIRIKTDSFARRIKPLEKINGWMVGKRLIIVKLYEKHVAFYATKPNRADRQTDRA